MRKEASQALSQLYVAKPEQISRIIIAGLWRTVASGEKDGITDIQNINQVAYSICLSPSEIFKLGGDVSLPTRKEQMISMLVLSRPELLPRVSWIDLCLRVEVDPGELARESGGALVQQILDSTDFKREVRHQKISHLLLMLLLPAFSRLTNVGLNPIQ